MDELKIVITGCVGSGKTTAIQSISDIPVIETDVEASDDVKDIKDTTTVAMDYGEIRLGDSRLVKLYGTPGQRRFSYMWEILAEGALGVIILLNNHRQDPIEDLEMYLGNFADPIRKSSAAIGVTHLDEEGHAAIEPYYEYMSEKGLDYPIFPVDARDKSQVRVMIEALAAMITLDEVTDAAAV